MQQPRERPFGVEVLAALNLIGAVYMFFYTGRTLFDWFQIGGSLLCAIGLYLSQPWGWWIAQVRFLIAIGMAIFLGISVGWQPVLLAQIGTAALIFLYLCLPGVRAAFGVGRKSFSS